MVYTLVAGRNSQFYKKTLRIRIRASWLTEIHYYTLQTCSKRTNYKAYLRNSAIQGPDHQNTVTHIQSPP